MKRLVHLFMKASIKNRMIISLAVILAAAFTLTNILYYNISKKSVRENIIGSVLPLTRDNIYSEIQVNLIRPIFISSLMANDTFLKDWAINGERDTDEIRKYLETIKNKYGFFSSFFVSEKTHRYYHFNGILKTISRPDPHDIWYYNFIDTNREYDLDVDTNEAEGNRLTVFINHRLTDYKGRLLGVTGVGLNMDSISEMLKSYNRSYGSNIYLVDKDGYIQVHSDEKFIEKVNIKEQPELGPIAGRILAGTDNSYIYEFKRGDRDILLTTRFIPEFDWFLCVEIDQHSRMAGILTGIKATLLLGLVISVIIISIAIATANFFQGRITIMAMTDELTGAYNRKEFDLQFKKAASGFYRNNTPFSIIIFDIDKFKNINDSMGHLNGDLVLRVISEKIMESMRPTDMLVRWGGDEFIFTTQGNMEQSMAAAERLRALVAGTDFSGLAGGENIKQDVTISCGVAEFTKDDTMDSLLSRADEALYRAKNLGRNRVEG